MYSSTHLGKSNKVFKLTGYVVVFVVGWCLYLDGVGWVGVGKGEMKIILKTGQIYMFLKKLDAEAHQFKYSRCLIYLNDFKGFIVLYSRVFVSFTFFIHINWRVCVGGGGGAGKDSDHLVPLPRCCGEIPRWGDGPPAAHLCPSLPPPPRPQGGPTQVRGDPHRL